MTECVLPGEDAQRLAAAAGSNVSMLLHGEYRNCMVHSIETRLPSLSYRLVEFAQTIFFKSSNKTPCSFVWTPE
jgi:hypothetical protein